MPYLQEAKWPWRQLLTAQSLPTGPWTGLMGWLRVGRVRDGIGDLRVLGAPLIIISPPHPQFRDNLQDLLPTMPKADDYFLLRWLRGEASGISGSQERVWEALGTVHRVVKNRALESACFGLESKLPFKLIWHKNSAEP